MAELEKQLAACPAEGTETAPEKAPETGTDAFDGQDPFAEPGSPAAAPKPDDAFQGEDPFADTKAPTAATAVTLADFRGQYSGTYNVTSCTADGMFAGFCDGFAAGTSLPIVLSLTQSDSSASGSVTLGSLGGTFQGTVSGGTLNGTATINQPPDQSLSLDISIANWSTTIAGNAISGRFTIVFRSSLASGSATLSATIVQLSR
jgi:hypothetical protein